MSNQPQRVLPGTGRARGRPPSQSTAQPGAGPQAGAPPAGAQPAGAWGPGASGGPPSQAGSFPPGAGGIPSGPRPPTQQPGGRGRAGRGSQSQVQPLQQGMPGQRPEMGMAQPQQPPPQQPPAQQHSRPLGLEEAGEGPPQAIPTGRASHRGAVDARPGQEGRVPYQMMGQMSLEGSGDNGRSRKRGALSIQFVEKHTKPVGMESKKGNAGQGMQMCSNMFHFQPITESHIYQYHVDFSPDVLSKRLRTGMINSQAEVLGPIRITDGMLLFLPKPLPNEVTELFTKKRVRQVDQPDSEEIVKITVKFIGEVQPNTNTVLQIYNILFKRVLQHLGMTLIQRSYFNPHKAHHLDQFKVDIWPGYSTAIGLYERQIGLVADVSHKVLKTNTVYDFMKQQRGDMAIISTKLIGRIVMTRYNNKTYRVDDIDWKQSPMSTFKLRNGTEQRYMDYYKNAYACEIYDPQQPLLMSMPKKKDVRAGQEGFICLIPELCIITGIDDDMRADFRMMQDFQKVTRVGPHERARELESLSEEIAKNPAAKKELADWNLQLSGRLADVQGRVLDKELIRMVKNRELISITVDQDASWSRNMRDVRCTVPIPLENKSWVCIYPSSAEDGVRLFMSDLFQVGRGIGMNIGEADKVILSPSPRVGEYKNAIKTNCNNTNLKLVMVVLNTKDKQVYDAVKLELCTERAIPSQCVAKGTIQREKGRKSVATKVALQINCKLGGELWETDMPMSNAMVVGIDTYHDSASKRRSAVGFVASINKNLTKYYSRSFLQDQNEELAKGLNSALTACLKKYSAVNGQLPTRIFIYRDGVGDGMLSMVEEFEVPQIEAAIKAMKTDYEPMLSVIVVKKRMNTRIFRVDNRNRNQPRYDNPPPGTVVDDIITKPMWYDFFIVSQSVNQGTVAPTHYHVLRDKNKFNVNIMQRLTYKLCHLYYNWPGTIRVPAPCQYAHKLAFLVGQSLHKPPHVELCDKLFYL